MKMEQVKQIASAVLYEGYLLYPYRHSALKNRQRWTFGVVYPRQYSQANGDLEPWHMRTECLLQGQANTSLEITARFLHLLKRSIDGPTSSLQSSGQEQRLLLNGQLAYEPWEEGVEREVSTPRLSLSKILAQPERIEIALAGERLIEQQKGTQEARIVREQQRLEGAVIISAEHIAHAEQPDLYKLCVQIENTTPFEQGDYKRRDAVFLYSFVSTHTLLHVYKGNFLSLIDTPEEFKVAAQRCQNRHTWPVLVGEKDEYHTLLSSPIILYDYPEIAPESPGALFDGTEIDEILALRILTLSDEEKAEIRRGDSLARALLERIEALTPEQFLQLHGTIRERYPRTSEQRDRSSEPLNLYMQQYPGEDYPPPEQVQIGGKVARVGDRVRLHPTARADAFDLLLKGKTARIVAISQDFENRLYLVVTVDDDPGREQWDERVLPGHRFFFFPEEVELIGENI